MENKISLINQMVNVLEGLIEETYSKHPHVVQVMKRGTFILKQCSGDEYPAICRYKFCKLDCKVRKCSNEIEKLMQEVDNEQSD